ncbi:hypothetical protein [Microbulbifer sp. SAOS-129_SWC]|uniref:hypothetical protein n=1 Tax=Microbulbifer sp. SAOS-129_SWC TaxID=3145235 RepID=UPI003216DAE5
MKHMKVELRHKLGLALLVTIALLGVLYYILNAHPLKIAFNLSVISAGLWIHARATKEMYVSFVSAGWKPCRYRVSGTNITLRQDPAGVSDKYIPFFRINYQFQGQDFSITSEDNLNLHLKEICSTSQAAREYLGRIANFYYGTKLFVNPDNPQIAYLRTGLSRDQVGIYIFSLVLILLPALTLLGVIEWR